MRPLTWLGALAAVLLAATASAQASAVVDEGTFMVSRQGTPLGRESFRIIRTPGVGGLGYRSISQAALGDLRITTALSTDSAGAPESYEATVTERGQTIAVVRGRGRPDRFSAMIHTRGTESSREYLVQPGLMLLDEDVFHQFFFVGLAETEETLTALDLREARTVRFRVERGTPASVVIGDQTVTALPRALIDSAGTRREYWLDPRGRVLKVSIPGRQLVALRDEPPKQ